MTKHILFLAISATLGVAAYSSFSITTLILIILFLSFLYVHFNGNTKIVLVNLVNLLLFATVAYVSELRHETLYTGEEHRFQITFIEQPNVDGNLLKAKVMTNQKEKLQLRYTISTEAEKMKLESNLPIGLTCIANGSLVEPEASRNENSFNYQRYLKQQNIHWILKVEHMTWNHCSVTDSSFVTRLQNFRQQGIAYVNEHFPPQSSGFVTALLFGDQTYIDEENLTNYQRLGLVHLLAISGLHVSFLTGILFFLGIRIGITREKMMGVILLFLPMYTILSGGTPSVLRACLMAMLFFLLLLWKKRISAIMAIGLVYLLLLLVQPNLLFNIGFQLSFAVTCAIILSLPIFQKYPQPIMQLFIVSVVCQLAALPILLYHFYEVSVLGIFLNVLYVPIYSSILLPFSILALLSHLVFPSLGDLLIEWLDKLFFLCNSLATIVSTIPLASISFGKPMGLIMMVLLIGIIGLFMKWESSSLKECKMWLYLLMVTLLFQYHIQKVNPYGEVVFIDVGQGDAIFIKLPFNRGNYLIDTGGKIVFPMESWQKQRRTYNTGDDVIIPFLKSKGVHHLDKLILTHADADHTGSATELIRNFKVREVVIGTGSETFYRDKDSIKWALSKNIPISRLKKGDSWYVGEAKFYILHPYQKNEDANDGSIVLFAEMGGLSWLFTGDASESIEKELMRTYPQLRVDILKVGHHGSKTSSSPDFLEQIKPKVAVISVGKDNRYGHPHRQVVEALEEREISVVRTDSDGAVSYKYRNKTGTFRAQLP